MNKKAKRRLVVTGGIVAIAMLVIVAIAGSGGAASSLTVGDLLTGDYAGKKVQVTGSVVDGSIETDGTAVRFDITLSDSAHCILIACTCAPRRTNVFGFRGVS